MNTVRTEKTSKGIKGAMVFGMMVMAGSAVAAWQGVDMTLAAYAAGTGVAIWTGARFLAWWQYG